MVLFFAGSSASPESRVLFLESFEGGFSHKWEPVVFESRTTYTISQEGTNHVLTARAEKSASGLAVQFDEPLEPQVTFSWKWAIDRIPPGGSDDEKKTFDHTARLFIAFRTFLGPPRTINYVWSNEAEIGTTYHHPSSGRSRFIVLQKGNDKAGEWLSESRNIAADWELLFGDDDAPDIIGLGIMTDSDGTASTVTGRYDDLRLSR